jgi:hypothetical protein
MKKLVSYGFIAIGFISCGETPVAFESRTPDEKRKIMREQYIVSDAPITDERPLPNVLSEKEVLLKAADAAIAEGVLDPSYYAYQINPALMDAKIETPILLIDANNGVPDTYIINAVDNNGITLARVFFSSNADVDEASFAGTLRSKKTTEVRPAGGYKKTDA